MTRKLWTRRSLLQTAGLAAAAGAQSVRALGAFFPGQEGMPATAQGTHLYAATAADSSSPAGLRVFTRSPIGWQPRQFFPAAQLRLLLADAEGHRLYAAHGREQHRGEPAGHVQVFRTDSATGLLTSTGRQSLALSGGTPVAMTLSPRSTLLVVATAEGVFSILPIHPEGELQPVTAAHKQVLVPAVHRSLTRMHFNGESQLVIETEQSLHIYECNTAGMRLTHKGPAPPRSLRQATPVPPAHAASLVMLTL